MMLRSLELAVLLMFGMVGISIWLVVRSVRRRLRHVRARFGLLPVAGFAWWQAYGDRHRMWRSVSAAARAGAAAVSAHPPRRGPTSLGRRPPRAAPTRGPPPPAARPRAA